MCRHRINDICEECKKVAKAEDLLRRYTVQPGPPLKVAFNGPIVRTSLDGDLESLIRKLDKYQ